VFICIRIKKDENQGSKCYSTTMMSRKTDKTVKETPRMCLLDRTRRAKDEGEG
jgi:hypothetical protein